MRTMARFAAFAMAAMTFFSVTFAPSAFASRRGGGNPPLRSSQDTDLQIYSPTQTVNVVLKLPGVSSFGCGPTQVSQLIVRDLHNKNQIPVTPLASSLQDIGYFRLQAGRPVTVETVGGFTCIQGMLITFVTLAQCPCNIGAPYNPTCTDPTHPFGGDPSLVWPNGVNLAEATINVPGTFQETVDISCNQGANSTINIQFLPDGSTPWNNGTGNNNVTSITNSWVDIKNRKDNNCNLTGVFAYNLTNCNAGPGACGDNQPFCTTTSPLCNIQRLGHGGLVKVNYMGPLAPPGP